MKIRKLAALCKAAKTIYLIDDNISASSGAVTARHCIRCGDYRAWMRAKS